MTTNRVAAFVWMSAISLVSFSCNRTSSISNKAKATTESVHNRTDSVVYMLTVDSISIPIQLKEIADFLVYSKAVPYKHIAPGYPIDYKDIKYLHFLNGQMIEGRQRNRILRKLKDSNIESIEYTPAEQAVLDYGQKASHGIIYIETFNKK